jgi:hypothetical protein
MRKSEAVAPGDPVMPVGDGFGFCFGQECGNIHLKMVWGPGF